MKRRLMTRGVAAIIHSGTVAATSAGATSCTPENSSKFMAIACQVVKPTLHMAMPVTTADASRPTDIVKST